MFSWKLVGGNSFTQSVKKNNKHTFLVKLDEDFLNISITLHFQEMTCTLKDFKELWEEVTQPAQLNSVQAVSELFQTNDTISQRMCQEQVEG